MLLDASPAEGFCCPPVERTVVDQFLLGEDVLVAPVLIQKVEGPTTIDVPTT